MTPEQRRTMQARLDNLYKTRKADLIAEVQLNYRVIDTNGMSKDTAASLLFEAEFGRAKVKAFNQPEEK